MKASASAITLDTNFLLFYLFSGNNARDIVTHNGNRGGYGFGRSGLSGNSGLSGR